VSTPDLFRFRRFQLELDGVVHGAFDSLELPGYETRVELDETCRKRPGLTRRTHARLTGGLANSLVLFRWFEGALSGSPDARSGAIHELDERGDLRVRHEFFESWPVRVRLGVLTPEQAFEVAELELAVGRWVLCSPSGEHRT
jgi:hypothetical protein